MELSNILLIFFGITLPLLIEKIQGSVNNVFKMRDLSKILAILPIYYGILIFFYRIEETEADSFHFYLFIRILLTMAFIFGVLRFAPLAEDAKRLRHFPKIEESSVLYVLILCFFLYTSFTIFLAVDFFPEKIELQLRNLIVLKAINENPFFSTPALILTEILAIVGEEIVFRYFAINAFRQKLKKTWVIVITSLIWTITHDKADFGIFLLGILLGYVFFETESLLLCVVLHFIFNFTIGTEIFYLFYKSIGSLTFPAYQYALALFACQILLYHLVKIFFCKTNFQKQIKS